MDNLIKIIKSRLCYEDSKWWDFLLTLVQAWKLFFYVGVPLLIVWIAATSYVAALNSEIAVENQLEIGERLDRLESNEFSEFIKDWIQKNIEVEGHIRKWVWSCDWSIHGKDWDYDDGAFDESVSGCGAGNQAWKEVNYVWTRVEALAARDKHNEETGHTAWLGENMILTPVPRDEE